MPKLALELETLDDVSEAFRELYTEQDGKFKLTSIEGLKTQDDIDRLQRATALEREEHKKTKAKYAKFVPYAEDADAVIAKLDKYDELEAAAEGKLDDDKINDLAEKRIKGKLAPMERENTNLKTENDTLREENESLKSADRRRKIHDAVREAAVASKMVETAVEDALLMGERVFNIDEEGNITSEEGVKPKEWLVDMQAKRPHWWPASQGGGAQGSGGGGGFASNPWSKDSWSMTEQGAIYRDDPVKAKRMAQAAGTDIGGRKPT